MMYIDANYKDKTFSVTFVAETADGNIETYVSFGWREADELHRQLDAHLRDWAYEMGGFDDQDRQEDILDQALSKLDETTPLLQLVKDPF